MKKIRFGIIGAGGFASKRPMPGLLKAKNCRAVALLHYDVDLTDIAKENGIKKIHDNIDDFLSDPEIDAVYIATPVFTHCDLAVKAASAGKHVLVEKPMALTVADCGKMIDVCAKNKVRLKVGYMRRYHPCHQKIKEIIDSGRLGRIIEARIQTHLLYPAQKGAWRQDAKISGGGAFMDMGSHCLELMEFFLGDISHVTAVADNIAYKYKAEDTAVAIFKFKSGALGIVDSSFSIPHRRNVIEIYGLEATLLAEKTAGPFSDPKLVLIDDGGEKEIKVSSKKDQYCAEFEDLADAIITGREPDMNGPDGLRNLKQIQALYKSAKENRRIAVRI